MLKCENVSYQYSKKQVWWIKNINLSVFNECFWIIWGNWAGKSTFLKCILWLLQYDWSINIEGFSPQDIEFKKKIWFMPENTYLYKHLTGYEYLEFSLRFYKKDKDEKNRIEEVLNKMSLYEAKNKKLSSYSKGMLQRIWVWGAIIHQPKYIFLDEPMSWLDPIWRHIIREIIKEEKVKKNTIFINTHILSDVKELCDRVWVINKWELIEVEKTYKIDNIDKWFLNKIDIKL